MRKSIAYLLVVSFVAPATLSAAGLPWERLRALSPGTELKVLGRGDRIFVGADDSTLTVLNLTDERLGRRRKQSLRDLVKEHPDLFLAPSGAFHDISRDMDITSDGGVSMGQQKIAVVEHIERADMRKTDAISRKTMSRGQKAALIAGITGGAILILIWAAIEAERHAP